MSLRITQNTLIRNALADLDAKRSTLSGLQEQASSGLRVNRPSDDPTDAAAALLLRAGLDANNQYESNVVQTRIRVGGAEAALSASNDVIIRARELALNGANDTNDAVTRGLIAKEVEALHSRLLSEANVRVGGAYLFSGFASDTAPFVSSAFVDGAPSPSTTFVGDSNEIEVPIDEDVRVSTGLDGRRVFQGDGDADGNPDAGKEDLFELLGNLRDALATNDASAIRGTLDRFDTALTQLGVERAELGAVETRLRDVGDRLAKRDVDLQNQLSLAQDADVAEVFSRLVNEQAALEAVLTSMQRLVQPTLLDFLA